MSGTARRGGCGRRDWAQRCALSGPASIDGVRASRVADVAAIVLAGLLLAPTGGALAEDEEQQPGIDAEKLKEIVEAVAEEAANDPSPDFTARTAADPAEQAALREILLVLGSRKASIAMNDAALLDAIDFFREVSGLNIVVSAGAKEWAEQQGRKTSLKLRDISLRSMLNLILDGTELAYGVRHGVLFIDLRDTWPAAVTFEIYDVSDIVSPRPDFPAPRLGLTGEERP